MATAKTEAKASNGKKWKKVERSRERFWKPDDDSTPLTGRLGEREERVGRFGKQALYLVETTEAGQDRKGEYSVGARIAVREWATVRGLLEHVGREVRITPAGLDGRVRLFDIEVAE